MKCPACNRDIIIVGNDMYVRISIKWKCRCGVYGQTKNAKVDTRPNYAQESPTDKKEI